MEPETLKETYKKILKDLLVEMFSNEEIQVCVDTSYERAPLVEIRIDNKIIHSAGGY